MHGSSVGGRGGSDTPPRPGVGVLLNGEGREKEILALINKVMILEQLLLRTKTFHEASLRELVEILF